MWLNLRGKEVQPEQHLFIFLAVISLRLLGKQENIHDKRAEQRRKDDQCRAI